MKIVVDKAASTTLSHMLIICGRSVNWWNEEIRQLVKDLRACFAPGLDKDNNWSDYLTTHKEVEH